MVLLNRLSGIFLSGTLLVGLAPTLVAKDQVQRNVASYDIPDVTLVNQDGKEVRLKELFSSGDPVMLDFVFATCTTICPVLSAGFSSFQRATPPPPANIRLISISIDPENDTPEVMKAYLHSYQARPGWDFLTGKLEDIQAVRNALQGSSSNKMSHEPLTYLWNPKTGRWTRLRGLMGAAQLTSECRRAGIL